MKRKVLTTVLMIFLFLLALPGVSSTTPGKKDKKKVKQRVKRKNLDQKYKDWLDLVEYIITPMEKDSFFKLDKNIDRDAFINLFWKLRDPTKGTPQNEFKDEHMKRFKHAMRYFRGSPKPGWMSDRGRIYILLGEPVNTNEILQNGLYPTLIWEYFGGVEKGLPTVFRVAFYKRHGSGDYQLYVPAVDGPASLLQSQIGEVDPENYYQVYTKIKDISPDVADICLTLIPGEPLQEFSPSLQDPILMSRIYELPKRKINASYARNFLNYKGLVKTNVITNYINVKSDLYILKDPLLNLNFVHFALLPEKISVDYSPDKDKYYFNFELVVVLKKDDEPIFQYTKNFPFYYTKEELDQELFNGIVIMDHFPVIEGNYQLIAILQNSLNKEVSYYEKNIKISPPNIPEPKVYGPLISYQMRLPSQQIYSPFSIMGSFIKVDPQKIFGLKDIIHSTFCADRGDYSGKVIMELKVKCQDEARPYEKVYTFEMTDGKKFEVFNQRLEKLNYGNYSITASLIGADQSILTSEERNFVVSPLSAIAHPPYASKGLKSDNQFFLYNMVARQYENINELDKAEVFYKKAFALNNRNAQLINQYASMLLKKGNYDEMLTIVENLKGQEKEQFNYYAMRGRAFYYKGMYEEAVDALLEANKIFDSDIGVINTLGLSLIRIGEKEEAIKALSASILLKKDQKDIAKLLEQLKNENQNEKKEKKDK